MDGLDYQFQKGQPMNDYKDNCDLKESLGQASKTDSSKNEGNSRSTSLVRPISKRQVTDLISQTEQPRIDRLLLNSIALFRNSFDETTRKPCPINWMKED